MAESLQQRTNFISGTGKNNAPMRPQQFNNVPSWLSLPEIHTLFHSNLGIEKILAGQDTGQGRKLIVRNPKI
jgi:hypothetical protein